MKKYLTVLILVTLLSSCSKIQTENNLKNNLNTYTGKSDLKSDSMLNNSGGINLNENYGVNLEEENVIKERFKLISSQYTKYSDLIKSQQYKDFVEYIYQVFDKYKKMNGNNEKELRYVFSVLIPKIVVDNWVVTKKATDEESELIIQSIKRKDFNSIEDKKLITEKFKVYLEEKNYNPFIKELTPEKINEIKKDNNIFIRKLLDPYSGIIYTVLRNRYDWNKTGIGYKPPKLEREFVDYLNSKMLSVFEILGYKDNEIRDIVFNYYKIKTLEELAGIIRNDFNYIVNKYGLKGKIPMDREYRNDEQNDIFKNRETVDSYISVISDGRKEEFERDLRNFRIKMYLLSHFGRDRKDLDPEQGLWSSRARSDFIDKKYGDGVQNIFRLSRYIKGEEVKIDFDKKL